MCFHVLVLTLRRAMGRFNFDSDSGSHMCNLEVPLVDSVQLLEVVFWRCYLQDISVEVRLDERVLD